MANLLHPYRTICGIYKIYHLKHKTQHFFLIMLFPFQPSAGWSTECVSLPLPNLMMDAAYYISNNPSHNEDHLIMVSTNFSNRFSVVNTFIHFSPLDLVHSAKQYTLCRNIAVPLATMLSSSPKFWCHAHLSGNYTLSSCCNCYYSFPFQISTASQQEIFLFTQDKSYLSTNVVLNSYR